MKTRPTINASAPATIFGSLSSGRRRLITGMQRNPFSRIENLGVNGGEPVFGPATRWIAETKLGTPDAIRPEIRLPDFALKREHSELFDQFDAIGSGNILTLEVRAGLLAAVHFLVQTK
jgi:hypothetical protein